MYKNKKNDKSTFGIVGVGRFGYALATELAASHAEILVIDRDEEKIRQMRELTENAFVVKTLDKSTLMDTGIQNCDVAVVCIAEIRNAEPEFRFVREAYRHGYPGSYCQSKQYGTR